MDTIVIKFGGSSLEDNKKLQIVANKVIKLYEENNNVVVVVSAQGKTTDKLIKEAEELSLKPIPREMDTLLSIGEQISASKLAILLNYLGYKAISLTGWQVGIYTNDEYLNAKIESINPDRIQQEILDGKIVIVTGFQGIDKNRNITTLGRGGSDTTAVALATVLKAKRCYIYSDVDGIYTADPNKVAKTQKLKNISYKEMYSLSSEGAKVLHDRCVEMGERFDVPIITGSTFNDNPGTVISHKLEVTGVKSITKKNFSKISVVGFGINSKDGIIEQIIKIANKNDLEISNIDINRTKISVVFNDIIKDNVLEEFHNQLIKPNI